MSAVQPSLAGSRVQSFVYSHRTWFSVRHTGKTFDNAIIAIPARARAVGLCQCLRLAIGKLCRNSLSARPYKVLGGWACPACQTCDPYIVSALVRTPNEVTGLLPLVKWIFGRFSHSAGSRQHCRCNSSQKACAGPSMMFHYSDDCQYAGGFAEPRRNDSEPVRSCCQHPTCLRFVD